MTPTVGVITISNNKALLVRHGQAARHKDGVYGIPGGRIQPGENDKEASLREFHEETGLITTPDDLIEYPNNVYHATIQMKTGPEDFIFHVFSCIKFSGDLKSSEETIPEWVEITELDQYKLLPSIKEIVKAQY